MGGNRLSWTNYFRDALTGDDSVVRANTGGRDDLSDNRQSINLETRYANLPVSLCDYIYTHSGELPPEAAFFYRLDPYGEETFDREQATYIAELCGRLLETLPPGGDAELRHFPPFLLRLRELCAAAAKAKEYSHIIMVGD